MPNVVYPTPLEVIRTVITSANIVLDSKAKKRLDDLAMDIHADYRAPEALIDNNIREQLARIAGDDFSKAFCRALIIKLQEYNRVVATIPVVGLNRAELLPILNEHLFSGWGVELLEWLFAHCGGPLAHAYVEPGTTALASVISWLDDIPEIAQWKKFISKDHRYQWKQWRDGACLPSSQTIKYWATKGAVDSMVGCVQAITIEQVQSLMLVARSFDEVAMHNNGRMFHRSVHRALKKGLPSETIMSAMRKYQKVFDQTHLAAIKNDLVTIGESLVSHERSHGINRDELRTLISKARQYIEEHAILPSAYYWLDWQEARWCVYAGDIDKATSLYQSAFEEGLYNAGENIEKIIVEALALSAIQGNRDLMRWLINAMHQFNFNFPSDKPLPEGKSKFTDYADEWEIQHWKAMFDRFFPKKVLFQGVDYDRGARKSGPLLLIDNKKLDLKRPDRRIKIGGTWKKQMPQLVKFALEDDCDAVKALLAAGANPDLCSDAGESALLLAIESLNPTNMGNANNRLLFDLLSSHSHSTDTLNRVTNKKRLTPLSSAIATGKYDIVRKVLDMGADPNIKAGTDLQSPLYKCLSMIGQINTDSTFKRLELLYQGRLSPAELTCYELDSVRRHHPGLAGLSPQDIIRYMVEVLKDPGRRQIFQEFLPVYKDKFLGNYSVEDYRKIAVLLIKRGADPNMEQSNPIKGYSPLMLATEMDDAYLVCVMLENGGGYQEDLCTSRKSYVSQSPGGRATLSV